METKQNRKIYKAQWAKANREKMRAYNIKWKTNNPQKVKELEEKYRKQNPEKRRLRAKELYNQNREHILSLKKIWRNSNPEKIKNIKNKVRAKPSTLEKEKISHKKWLALNADRVIKARLAYYSKPINKERMSILHKKWAKEHSDKNCLYSQKRRAMKKGCKGSYTVNDVHELYFRQKGKCVCCKVNLKNKYHIDHIMPLSRGGVNTKGNIQLLCPSCNLQKHSKDPIEFMQSRGYLL